MPDWDVLECEEQSEVNVDSNRFISDGKINIYPAVLERNLLRIQLIRGQLRLSASGFIGLIPLNDQIALDVKPKVPIASLERLLTVTQHAPIVISDVFRPYERAEGLIPSFLDLLTEGLLKAIETVIAEGRLKQYERLQRVTSFPRGRIAIGPTLTKCQARGRYDRATFGAYEQTADVPVNRLLKLALWTLAQRYAVLPRTRAVQALLRRLSFAYRAFDGVYVDKSKEFLSDRFVQGPQLLPTIRDYYRRAIDIGKLVVSEAGIDLSTPAGALILPLFLLNLEEIFEAYVRSILQSNLGPESGYVTLNGNLRPPAGGSKSLFDNEPQGLGTSNPATPDVTIARSADNVTAAIVEVKYKRITGVAQRDDINQTLTYAATYRSKICVIVHPKSRGGIPGVRFVGRIGDTSLFQYAFDLDASIVQQERAFVDAIRGLLQVTPAEVH